MKKRHIFSILILVIVISIILFVIFSFNNKSIDKNDNNVNILEDEEKIVETKKESIPLEKESDSIQEEKSNLIVPPTTNDTSKDNSKSPKDKEVKENIIEQKKEEPKEQPKENLNNEPTIDLEYERLLTLVEYKTHEECLNAGIDYQLKNIIEITNTMCQTIGYNNQLLGYKLTLWCGNETCNNYKK